MAGREVNGPALRIDEDGLLRCPYCRDRYTHLRKVKQIDVEGEVGVVLRFYCENANHDFFYTFRPYEGTTEIIGATA